MKPRSSMTLDEKIGLAIRRARRASERSQDWLGDKLGVSYQQVQKFEKGANRMSAAQLMAACAALGVAESSPLRAWIEQAES